MSERELCSFGPSCINKVYKRCTLCNGRYCKPHSGHGQGHANKASDFAPCGRPLINGKAVCEPLEKK